MVENRPVAACKNVTTKLGMVFCWGLGVLFLLSGIVNITDSNKQTLAIAAIISSSLLLPPVRLFFFKKTGKKLNHGLRIGIIVLLIIIASVGIDNSKEQHVNNTKKDVSELQNDTASDEIDVKAVDAKGNGESAVTGRLGMSDAEAKERASRGDCLSNICFGDTFQSIKLDWLDFKRPAHEPLTLRLKTYEKETIIKNHIATFPSLSEAVIKKSVMPFLTDDFNIGVTSQNYNILSDNIAICRDSVLVGAFRSENGHLTRIFFVPSNLQDGSVVFTVGRLQRYIPYRTDIDRKELMLMIYKKYNADGFECKAVDYRGIEISMKCKKQDLEMYIPPFDGGEVVLTIPYSGFGERNVSFSQECLSKSLSLE